jgi:Spy/CpxP family protein refolding chaperone
MGPKLKATAVLLGVFGLGIVTGIAWQIHAFRHWTPHHNPERRIARMKKELDLNPDQEKAVRDILEKAHQRATEVRQDIVKNMTQIRTESVTAIAKILTPDQRVKFEKMRAEHRHRHPFIWMEGGVPAPEPEKPGVK